MVVLELCSMTTKRARRQRSRGAAVIEMTLFLPLLMLLVFGMIDYGYYFYVSMTANEAARLALRTASSTTTGACGGASTAAATVAKTALKDYMTTIGMGAPANLTSTVECVVDATLIPLWHVKVQVDFPPAVGFIKSIMRTSTRTTGWVAYYSPDIYALGS
jgi:Flp pilus assembly protein TadG